MLRLGSVAGGATGFPFSSLLRPPRSWLTANQELRFGTRGGGDSLSPLLFIIAMEVLNRLFSKAADAGVLCPLGPTAVRSRCSLYADDVIMFMYPATREAEAIKAILQLFGDAAGLTINLSKFSLSPISGCEPDLSEIVDVLGCQLPISYLGLPLHSKAIPKSCVQGLVDKVAARLPAWRGSMMARSDRLVWIKSLMMAVLIYTMMANALPAWAWTEIEACCRRFFWAGADTSVHGKCAVSWTVVARPCELGGLGVLDMRLMSLALQVRWLWLQRNLDDGDRAWVELPLKVAPKVQYLLQASVHFVVDNGQRTLFWQDNWIGGKSVVDVAPALLWFMSKRTKSTQTVAAALHDGRWIREIRGGLSIQAIVQYLKPWDLIRDVRLIQSTQDRAVWRWSRDGRFSVHSAYRLLHEGSIHQPEVAIIWKTWAPLRVKIFLWLAWRKRI
ncbi:LOW QUALITY PROTEIN: hypothetical protein U9M48_013807 [Paspalum notatum var. saurae]|uniref:Reverse transcriptase domain-containing protein n=1 Tax=Paspalum notatum var. saurae TaxID=547442 RepID=A0AAQ3WJV8_PASNO